MRKPHHRVIIPALVVAVLLVVLAGSVALAGRSRLSETPDPDLVAAPTETGESEDVMPSDPPPSPQSTSDVQQLAEEEERIAEAFSPSGLYEPASSGLAPEKVPPILSAAIADADGYLPSRLLLADANVDDTSGVLIETMFFTDGRGYILVIWQEWPEGADPSVMAQPGASVTSVGEIDLVVADRDVGGDSYRLVRMFDGLRVLSVESWNVEDVSVQQMKSLAAAVFGRLP